MNRVDAFSHEMIDTSAKIKHMNKEFNSAQQTAAGDVRKPRQLNKYEGSIF